jgi:hypothetical protein
MNRTLKRPMFRIGGSAGTGITSGLDQPQKMANGGRTGYQQGSMPSFQASGVPGFLTSFGLNLLATPPAGNIFQTAGMAAREPFNQLQASQAKQRQIEAEKEFLRSERLEGQKFEEGQLEKRLDVEREKINKSDTLTVPQLAATYLDDFDGDMNKATNKAEYYLNIRPLLANEATGVGETQIGGIIEVDLSDRKQAKTFATRNRNKVGKVFYDLNTGKLVKLVKNPEDGELAFLDYNLGASSGADTEGEILAEANENEFKPKQTIKEVFEPGLTEADKFILETIEKNRQKKEKGMEEIPNYNIYR